MIFYVLSGHENHVISSDVFSLENTRKACKKGLGKLTF